MTRPLDQLMQKEMDRKQFLLTLGFGAASILGFSTIIHLLTGKSNPLQQLHHGFGSGAYGGNTESK